jgi:flavin reductase
VSTDGWSVREAHPAEPPDARAAPGVPDRAALRSVLGAFATGITVLTAGRGAPRGMTANSFTSVSLDPPLILVCVQRDAAMHEAILETRVFAVSVLADHQEDLARYFADHHRPRGEREFDVVDCRPGVWTGAPVLSGALAWLECRVTAVYGGGDHSIFLGSVLGADRDAGADALLYYGGRFRRIAPREA